MADLISADFKRRALARWEACVNGTKVERYLAYRAGPPNWMALEDWRGEKVETFVAAARRVRDRYFPGGEPAVTGPETVTKVVTSPEMVTHSHLNAVTEGVPAVTTVTKAVTDLALVTGSHFPTVTKEIEASVTITRDMLALKTCPECGKPIASRKLCGACRVRRSRRDETISRGTSETG